MKEFQLIEHVRSFNHTLGESVVVPPGDDLGAIRVDGGAIVLAGVDQVLGGVHLPPDAAPERYARKVLRRSLSDVAAMAAIPTGALVTAALPPGTAEDWGIRFADAINDEAGTHGCPIFGGDVAVHHSTSASPHVTATVLASPDPMTAGRVLCRTGAVVGDRIFVSGSFGGSLDPDGGGHHETFQPRVEFALALHRLLGESLHCMIDVSDGLLADAGHLARESQVRFVFDLARIPRRGGVSGTRALTDGEDYELCFTVGPDAQLPMELAGVCVTEIGTVDAGGGVQVLDKGNPVELRRPGWEHEA